MTEEQIERLRAKHRALQNATAPANSTLMPEACLPAAGTGSTGEVLPTMLGYPVHWVESPETAPMILESLDSAVQRQIDARRLRVLLVSENLLLEVLFPGVHRARDYEIENGIPFDGDVRDVRYDAFRGMIEILVWSAEFEPLLEGAPSR